MKTDYDDKTYAERLEKREDEAVSSTAGSAITSLETKTRYGKVQGVQMMNGEHSGSLARNRNRRMTMSVTETPTKPRDVSHTTPADGSALDLVAQIAAQCCLDLDANLKSAYEEYMAGDLAHGAYQYVLLRHGAIHKALHDAGYTEKHKIFGWPVKPNTTVNRPVMAMEENDG